MISYVDYDRRRDDFVVVCPEHGEVTRAHIDPEDSIADWADVCSAEHDREFHADALPRWGKTGSDEVTALDLDAAELTAVRAALRYATLRRPDLRAGIPPVLLP